MSRITHANVVQRQGQTITNADLVAHGVSLLGPNKFAAFNGITCADGDHIALSLDTARVPYVNFQETMFGWLYYLSEDADSPSPMTVAFNGGSGGAVGISARGSRDIAAWPADGSTVYLILQAEQAFNNGHAQVVRNG